MTYLRLKITYLQIAKSKTFLFADDTSIIVANPETLIFTNDITTEFENVNECLMLIYSS
jgi:hypothetical protein